MDKVKLDNMSYPIRQVDKVGYAQLSTTLKTAIVISYIVGAIYLIAFIAGMIQGAK
jgi:hypothetical protein